jgi:hypothetical protein
MANDIFHMHACDNNSLQMKNTLLAGERKCCSQILSSYINTADRNAPIEIDGFQYKPDTRSQLTRYDARRSDQIWIGSDRIITRGKMCGKKGKEEGSTRITYLEVRSSANLGVVITNIVHGRG